MGRCGDRGRDRGRKDRGEGSVYLGEVQLFIIYAKRESESIKGGAE